MKRITLILAAVMSVFTACAKTSGTRTTLSASESDNNQNSSNMKALVVFFSHAGENYSVGNIQIGNTKLIADYISELTGADQFEIVTHKYDGMSYKTCCDVAQDEQINDERPEFTGKIARDAGGSPADENVADYDIIFIGGPVWWGTYPQVMFTFFDTYDLNGKTIIPFTTHEGSGLGSCVSDLKKEYPRATFKTAFSIYGHECKNGKAKVEKWINSLGL